MTDDGGWGDGGWMDGWTEGRMAEGQVDGRIGGQVAGWLDAWTDGQRIETIDHRQLQRCTGAGGPGEGTARTSSFLKARRALGLLRALLTEPSARPQAVSPSHHASGTLCGDIADDSSWRPWVPSPPPSSADYSRGHAPENSFGSLAPCVYLGSGPSGGRGG